MSVASIGIVLCFKHPFFIVICTGYQLDYVFNWTLLKYPQTGSNSRLRPTAKPDLTLSPFAERAERTLVSLAGQEGRDRFPGVVEAFVARAHFIGSSFVFRLLRCGVEVEFCQTLRLPPFVNAFCATTTYPPCSTTSSAPPFPCCIHANIHPRRRKMIIFYPTHDFLSDATSVSYQC